MQPRSLAIALGVVLAGAGSALAQSAPVRTTRMPRLYLETAPDARVRAFEARVDVPASEAIALVANRTRLIAPMGAPMQVAFADSGGSVSLWFPRSGELRRGSWHIEERIHELFEGGRAIKTRRQATVCFNYGGAIPNIFAPEHLRSTQCAPVSLVRRYMLDSQGGDVFGLGRGTSPGALGPIEVRTINDLIRRLRR